MQDKTKPESLEYILEIIEKEKPRTMSELLLALPYQKSKFYELYPEASEKMEHIKEAINRVKVEKKQKLRKRWEESENPTLELAAFKLMATPEELEALSMTKTVNENTHTVNMPVIQWVDAPE